MNTRGTKCKRAEIDYKQYHTDGTLLSKSLSTPKKILPSTRGPSESRIASQEMIMQKRNITAHKERIIGTAIKTENIKKEIVPITRSSCICHKLIKEEPTIRMTHRKEKPEGPERVVHPSSRLCRKGNKGGYWDNELPDLPTVQTNQ